MRTLLLAWCGNAPDDITLGGPTLVRVEQLNDNALNIFTDGSAYGSPRRGGYGFIFVTTDASGKERRHEEAPTSSLPGSDAQEMELLAVVRALDLATSPLSPVALSSVDKIVIRSDSRYVAENFETAYFEWAQNRWIRKGGAPVMNARLWKELNGLRRKAGIPIWIKWVPGKSSEITKRVDKLAKGAAKAPPGKPRRIKSVRRKWTDESIEPGSVPVVGQEIEIRIVDSEWHPLQRCYRSRYEVVSGEHEGKVDWIFHDTAFRHRNVYVIRMNRQKGNTRIAEILEEIPAQDHDANPSG